MPTTTDLSSFLTVMLWICGVIATVAAACGIIARMVVKITRPQKEITERMDKYDRILDSYDSRLTDLENTNKLILKTLFTLIDHEITGNSIESLKQRKKEINEFIIDK